MSVLVVTATSITHMTVATLRRLLGGAHLQLHVKGAVAATADQDNAADPDNDATADTDTDAVHEPSLALPLSIALIVGEPARGLVGVDPDRTPELYVMCSEAVAEHRSESVCSIEVGVESPADWAFGRREAEAAAVGIGAAIERLQVPAEDDQRRATLHGIAVVFLRSCSPSAQHAAMRWPLRRRWSRRPRPSRKHHRLRRSGGDASSRPAPRTVALAVPATGLRPTTLTRSGSESVPLPPPPPGDSDGRLRSRRPNPRPPRPRLAKMMVCS